LGISGGEHDGDVDGDVDGEVDGEVDGTVTDQSHGIQSFKSVTFSDLINHLRNLLRALRVLVTSAFPVPVPMPITRIVGLVQRLLVVDITRIHMIQRVGRTSGQVTSLGVGLPGLQVAALDVLRCMMGACRGHIVPYMSDVNELLAGGLETVIALKLHGRDEMDVDVVCGLHAAVRSSSLHGRTFTLGKLPESASQASQATGATGATATTSPEHSSSPRAMMTNCSSACSAFWKHCSTNLRRHSSTLLAVSLKTWCFTWQRRRTNSCSTRNWQLPGTLCGR
jgi:hypothetical protein